MRLPQSCRVAFLAAALSLGLCGVVVGAADPLAGLPPVRHANALFSVPEGWTRGEYSEYTADWFTITAPPSSRGIVNIYLVSPHRIGPDGLRGVARDRLAHLRGGDTPREEEPVAVARHPGGGEMLTVFVSYGDREGPTTPRSWSVITFVDGGDGTAQSFHLNVVNVAGNDGRAMIDAQRPLFEALVREARLPSRVELARSPGGDVLSLGVVLRVTDFVEWLLDVPFTQAQRDAIQAHFVEAWRRGDKEEMDGVREALAARDEIDKLDTKEKRELVRQKARVELLAEFRRQAAAGDAICRGVVASYDAAQTPIAAGEPPLTRQAADASLEVIFFMASEVAGVRRTMSPTPAQKDAWAKELAASYAAMPADRRADLAEMPVSWAALRALWPELPAEERAKLAAAWGESPVVRQAAAHLKGVASAEESARLGRIYREHDAHRQLINMGAYRLNYRYYYR